MPGQTVLCLDGRTPAGAGSIDALCDPDHPATATVGDRNLVIDYTRYDAGEEALAWLDAEVRVDADEEGARAAAGRLVRAVVAKVSDEADAIGHVKFLIRDHLYDVKVSHTAADETPNQALLMELRQLERLSDRRLYVIVNARAEIGAEPLQRILERAVAPSPGGETLTIIRSATFHPAPPQPVQEIT